MRAAFEPPKPRLTLMTCCLFFNTSLGVTNAGAISGIGFCRLSCGGSCPVRSAWIAKSASNGPSGPKRVTNGGLGRTDAGCSRRAFEENAISLRFNAIIDRRCGPVGVDVTDLRWGNPGLGRRMLHHLDQRRAFGLRLRQVKKIGGVAVTGQLTQGHGSASLCVFTRFKNEKRRGFAQEKAGAIKIEGTAALHRCRLEAIETNKDKLGQGLKASGQDTIGGTRGNHIGGVTDGVGATGAGIRNDDGSVPQNRGPAANREPVVAANNGRSG